MDKLKIGDEVICIGMYRIKEKIFYISEQYVVVKDSDSTTMSIINKSRLRTNVYHHERFYIEIGKTGNSIFIYD